MSVSFPAFPTLDSTLLSSAGFLAGAPELSYTENHEIFPLKIGEEGSGSSCHSGPVRDEHHVWDPMFHSLCLEKRCSFSFAFRLFGEKGVAPLNATLGLALEWVSTKSSQRGVLPFGEFTVYAGCVEFSLKHTFPKGTLRGSLILRTLLYLKEAGPAAPGETCLARRSGSVLGRFDTWELFLDGNGSVFPIVQISEPSKPLWEVYFSEFCDPMTDSFDSENVEIRLNRSHPSFELLNLDASPVRSPLLLEVLTCALMIIVQSARDALDEDWDRVLSGTGFQTGSIAEAIHYFVEKLLWDVSAPAKLAASIRASLESGI